MKSFQVSFMHQWSYIELRRSTVFAPDVFLYQMANTITVQVLYILTSHLILRVSFQLHDAALKMAMPFKKKNQPAFDLLHTLMCTQEYETPYEMANVLPFKSVHYLQPLSPSLKLTDRRMDAFASLAVVENILLRQLSCNTPSKSTLRSPVRLVEDNAMGIWVKRKTNILISASSPPKKKCTLAGLIHPVLINSVSTFKLGLVMFQAD